MTHITTYSLFITLVTLTGCSYTDGEPWGWVSSTTIAQGPIAETGGQLAERVTVDTTNTSVDVRLVERTTTAGGSGGSFDPQSPPEGYSLCHNGHCHSEEGELVPYEEIQAELASSGGSSTATVARLSGDGSLTDGGVTMTRQPVFDVTRVDSVELQVSLEVRGTVDVGGEEVDLVVLTSPFTMTTETSFGFGPEEPAERTVQITFDWEEVEPFDGVDFAALDRRDGAIRITQVLNPDARNRVVAALREGHVEVDSREGSASDGTGDFSAVTRCVKRPPTVPNEHACYHACADEPLDAQSAVLDPATEAAPAVVRGSIITLDLQPDGQGQYVGWVRYDAPIEPGTTKNIFFHTVHQVPVSARIADTGSEMTEAEQTEFGCDYGLAWSNSIPMEHGEHLVRFGPTDRSRVTTVVVPENGPDNLEDDH